MPITRLILTACLLGFCINLPAQEADEPKRVFKAPNGKPFPVHWGQPPLRQTRDLRALPAGYGRGSGTLARWIQEKLDNDAKKVEAKPIRPPAPIPAPPIQPPAVFDPNAKAMEQAKADTAKIQAAIKLWESIKTKCQGNYSYKVSFSSWVGFGHETTIVVENNKVTERHYRSFNRRPKPVAPGAGVIPPPEGEHYLEKGLQLGKNKKGAPVKTLDELYQIALATAKKPLKQFERRFIRNDKQGLLVSCYIMDRRIADDAPRNGLVVSSITLAKDDTANKEAVGKLRSARIHALKTEITRLKDFARRARFTPEGLAKHNAKVAELEKELTNLQAGVSDSKNKKVYRAPNGKPFPTHWGAPPLRQTRDLKPFPGGYGRGSGTLARWIQENLEKDAAKGGNKPTSKIYKAPNGKPFPARWGAPPRLQTSDFGPLPGGYGMGSSTLGNWIKNSMAKDAKAGVKPAPGHQAGPPSFEEWVKGGKKIPAGRVFIGGSPWFNESTGKRRSDEEVYKMLYGRGQGGKPIRPMPIKPGGRKPFPAHWGAPPRIQTKDLRPLPGGYGTGSSTLAGWIRMNMEKDAKKKRPKPSKEFDARHPAGSFVPGRLLVGMEKGHTQEQCQKVLAGAIPDLKVTKGMFNNTILVISLPNTINEEQAIAALKKVQGVKYAELDGVVSIQSGTKPGVGVGPGIQIQPRIQR